MNKKDKILKNIAELIRINQSTEVDNSELVAELILHHLTEIELVLSSNYIFAKVPETVSEQDTCCGRGCDE